jgi:hypothetical protein
MNDVVDALGPLASTLVGGGVAAIIMKMAVTKWFKSIEKDSETLREVDKTLAVLIHRVSKIERDINGIGASLRRLADPAKPGPL